MKEAILNALSTVIDPDLKKDLVSLGMIKNLQANDSEVSFTIELTTPVCPLKDELESESRNAILKVFPEAKINIDFDSRVTAQSRESNQILSNVKNIILVSSGKGGVGKSTLASNIALAMSRSGAKVGLLDADIHGPSVPDIFKLEEKPELIDKEGKNIMMPLEYEALKIMSIGFLVDPEQALVWRGPMVSSALRQLFLDTDWGSLDYLFVDLPPGTGDIHLTLAQQFPITGALIVTTPQSLALSDVKKSAQMFVQPQISIPLIGFVENMAYFVPADSPEKKYYIFGNNENSHKLSKDFNAPLLSSLPLVMNENTKKFDQNLLLDREIISEHIIALTQSVAQQIAVINAKSEKVTPEI